MLRSKAILSFAFFFCGVAGNASSVFSADFDIQRELSNISKASFKIFNDSRRYPQQVIKPQEDANEMISTIFSSSDVRLHSFHNKTYHIISVTDLFQEGAKVETKCNEEWRTFFENASLYVEATDTKFNDTFWVSYSLVVEGLSPYFLGILYQTYTDN